MIASFDNDCELKFVVGLAYLISGGLHLAGARHGLLGRRQQQVGQIILVQLQHVHADCKSCTGRCPSLQSTPRSGAKITGSTLPVPDIGYLGGGSSSRPSRPDTAPACTR